MPQFTCDLPGHMSYFHFGAIVNKAVVNVPVEDFMWTYVFISPG
jgi:hypothetical protein